MKYIRKCSYAVDIRCKFRIKLFVSEYLYAFMLLGMCTCMFIRVSAYESVCVALRHSFTRSLYPCGGGVEYLHRVPASRKRRRNGTKKRPRHTLSG
jgi:hypothetical protein